MAAEDVGKKAFFHDSNGDHVCWIAAYEAGRDAGDHLLSGFPNASGLAADYPNNEVQIEGMRLFSIWSVYREEAELGTFRLANL